MSVATTYTNYVPKLSCPTPGCNPGAGVSSSVGTPTTASNTSRALAVPFHGLGAAVLSGNAAEYATFSPPPRMGELWLKLAVLIKLPKARQSSWYAFDIDA